MFRLYLKNVPYYLVLILAVILFLTIPQKSLEHWLSKKVDPLVHINAIEFYHTPLDDHFYHDKNKVKVTYDVQEMEDSNLYNIEARYKWFETKTDYESLYIQTGNGERIKEILEDFFKQNPSVIVTEEDIDQLIKNNINTDFHSVNYSTDVVSRVDYTRVIVTTYCGYCTHRWTGNDPISDYIYYEL